jgi:hypothetical protein
MASGEVSWEDETDVKEIIADVRDVECEMNWYDLRCVLSHAQLHCACSASCFAAAQGACACHCVRVLTFMHALSKGAVKRIHADDSSRLRTGFYLVMALSATRS